jgi:hypothetical protein
MSSAPVGIIVVALILILIIGAILVDVTCCKINQTGKRETRKKYCIQSSTLFLCPAQASPTSSA